MDILLSDREFLDYCYTASPEEMVGILTNHNVRGLENIALRSISSRTTLPPPVVNVLLFYFFHTFANQVYDRNDLARVYDYWASEGIRSVSEAVEIAKQDIHGVLKQLKES